jgi:hypothetical protein
VVPPSASSAEPGEKSHNVTVKKAKSSVVLENLVRRQSSLALQATRENGNIRFICLPAKQYISITVLHIN